MSRKLIFTFYFGPTEALDQLPSTQPFILHFGTDFDSLQITMCIDALSFIPFDVVSKDVEPAIYFKI